MGWARGEVRDGAEGGGVLVEEGEKVVDDIAGAFCRVGVFFGEELEVRDGVRSVWENEVCLAGFRDLLRWICT